MSKPDHTLEPEATPLRRLEVSPGTGRRRRFSQALKAWIVADTLVDFVAVYCRPLAAPASIISEPFGRGTRTRSAPWHHGHRITLLVAGAGDDRELPQHAARNGRCASNAGDDGRGDACHAQRESKE